MQEYSLNKASLKLLIFLNCFQIISYLLITFVISLEVSVKNSFFTGIVIDRIT